MRTMDGTRYRDYGLTILRVGIGIIFFAHGYTKITKMGIDGTAGFMGHLGIPIPGIIAWYVIIAETVGGIALILGIFTLPFGIALVIDMAGAIYYAKSSGGLLGPKGFELELSLLVASAAIARAGPAALSVRQLVSRRQSNE